MIKSLKEGLREKTVHQNRLKRSFVKVEIKLTPIYTMRDTEKTLDKREELMKFLQPSTKAVPVTTLIVMMNGGRNKLTLRVLYHYWGQVKKNQKITN